ncbi:hypothetical protein OEA41_009598 [Lepraria neglecta]|uniref:Uncharacterized protein n=1 Tax=Lepraria neglecta TaxID=209136 RepID=A0AAD9Z565_9LECA|nr:hypothetical protein OEA41_009598 [Lepraria neglecta]
MEFKGAMDKVFEEIHKVHNVMIEVNYQQWCSRKDQWDEDWDIKSGGPSKEIREELELLPSWLECHDGVLRPKLRQSGGSLLPNLDLTVETDIPESCTRNHPNKTWPIEPEASESWNRHDTQPQGPTLLNSTYPGPFNYHHMEWFSVAPQYSGPAENFSIPYAASGFDERAEVANPSSYMSPPVASEWNAENTTLPPGTSISTYGGFPVYSTSDILDTSSSCPHGGTSIGINSYADPLTAAQERERALSQEQMRAGPPDSSLPPVYPRPSPLRTPSNYPSFVGHHDKEIRGR